MRLIAELQALAAPAPPSPDRIAPAPRLALDLDLYRQRLEALGLAEVDAAALVGVHRSEVTRWRSVAPGPLYRRLLAEALAVEPGALWRRVTP